jgi:threonine-phosphate decarboxylase
MTEIPAAGAHGGDGARIAAALGIGADEVLDLSASLNPFGPDVPKLVERHLGALRRYPDVDRAEAHLADGLGLDPARTVITAGGAQAIALVAAHLGRGRVDDPEFSLYRRHLPTLDPTAPRWRSDPHNPTGRLAPEEPAPEGPTPEGSTTAGVWDEAFLPLAAGVWTRGRPGWSVGSLTKAFACPGLRLGYAVAPTADDAAALRARRPEWAVDGLACAVLPDLLERADPPGWTKRIAEARADTHAVLTHHGLRPEPSDAPWLLVPDSAGLRTHLAHQAVAIRDCSSFGLCNYSRIAIPGEAGIERLGSALAGWNGHGEREPEAQPAHVDN